MPRLFPSRAKRVTPLQFVASLLSFALLAGVGGILGAALVVPLVAVAGTATKESIELFDTLPVDVARIVEGGLPQQSNIYARDGETLLATFFIQNRVVVPLEEISPWLQQAVVATEDRRFFSHKGVDGEGLARALLVNATQGESQGASTITQQLVKNTLLQAAVNAKDLDAQAAATEVSISRKINEIKLAMAFEVRMNAQYGKTCTEDPKVDCGKEKILEGYLNIAQFGPSVYGVEAASQYYFGKPASQINALEAATIAGITKNPYAYDPIRFEQDSQDRRDTVLLLMNEHFLKDGEDVQLITDAQLATYLATPLADTLNINKPKFSCVASVDAPFFCDYVTKVIEKDPVFDGKGTDLLYVGGLDIVTTLDIAKQRAANEEVQRSLPKTDPTAFGMALVSIDVPTGEILAMAINRDFDPAAKSTDTTSTAVNYATDRDYGGSRGFSPGSTFKPILLAQWLREGHSLDQAVSGNIRKWDMSLWHGSCLGAGTFAGQPAWRPGNVGDTSANQQSALTATAHSINTSYVAMTSQLDLCGVADMAELLGFHRADGVKFETVPSMTLGTQNASPLTMATVAATLANDGVRCTPVAILSITKPDGTSVDVPPHDCRQTVDADVAKGVTYALTQVMAIGSGSHVRLKDRPAAGKTGTSQKNTHTWFLGYTPQLATVVWMGHPDHDVPQQHLTINGKPYRFVYGSTIAAPTWKRFMDRALAGQPVLKFPTSPPSSLGWFDLTIPDVRGMPLQDAENAINDAGYRWEVDPVQIYDELNAPGTVVFQSALPEEELGPGATIVLAVARNTLPSWWFNWPASWNPCVAPSDWWDDGWPPSEWASGGPSGWSDAGCGDPDPDPDPDPEPTPSPTA